MSVTGSISVPTRSQPSSATAGAEQPGSRSSARAASVPGWLKVAFTILCGSALGLWLTAEALTRRFDPGVVTVGPWATWPRVGTVDIDPYARAILARTGEVAMASQEGVAFTAIRDSAGKPLDGRCAYAVSGSVPPARAWTLGVAMPDGRGVPNAAAVSGLVSDGLLRREDGGFSITAAAQVQPGNWLPLPGPGPFVLQLRLYDTPLGNGLAGLGDTSLPTIAAAGCRP